MWWRGKECSVCDMYRTWGGKANIELCLIFTENGLERQSFNCIKYTRKVMLQLQKYSLSLAREDCSHCAEAGPRGHTDAVKYVHLIEPAKNCKTKQL